MSGRWTAKDPSGLGGGLNVYEYAAGDPIDLIDMDGNDPAAIIVAEVASGAIWGAMTDLLLQIALNGPRCIDWGQVWSAAKSGAVFGAFAGLFRAWNAPWFCLTGCFVKGTLVDTDRGRRPIEEIALGERVGPESSECASVSMADWVDIGLETGPRDDGAPARVVLHLVRPREWVEANGAREGATIELELRELNIEGSARVTSVQRAPAIRAGSRCPVTGTIRRTGVRVMALELERGAPMELTANHRVFSATRNGWVAAGDLRTGEELQARDGSVRVRSVRESGRGLTNVFNLEVFARHEFFVGEAGVRAHNGYSAGRQPLAGSGPTKGFIELSDRVRSSAAVRNFAGKRPVDFVYDSRVETFIMGNNPRGHDGAAAAGRLVPDRSLVGGRISRDGTGQLVTDEWSGHFGINWTDEIRASFRSFMASHGIVSHHRPW